MVTKGAEKLLIATLFFTIILSLAPSILKAETESYHLDNGMQVILKENHNSPMVASVIFIKSGSKYESRYENGITHFLEHLLFDGTVNQSREELDLSIRDLGGYLNAFTRKDLTGYLVLLPKQYIDFGMTVQADMLFNSIFPDQEMPKERQVVVEEIKMGADRPGSAAEAFKIQFSMAGTDYARPVLGYKAFIENIPREAVIDYWKKYYRPENMITLVIGDFDSEKMKQQVADIFGRYPIDKTTPPPEETETEPKTSPSGNLIAESQIFDTVANVQSTYLNFSFNAPAIDQPDYIAADLLAQYLNLDEISPLKVALKSGADPLATEVSIGLTPYDQFSRFEISIITEKPDQRQAIAEIVINIMAAIDTLEVDLAALEGIKTSNKCDNIYMADKLHYYGFIIAPTIMTGGWDFIQSYPDRLDAVVWSECQAAATKWLREPRSILTMVRPAEDSSALLYDPPSMTLEEVQEHFAPVSFAQHELVKGHELTLPATDQIDFLLEDQAEYTREVLDNGLTILIKSTPESEVFAINILGKNRSAMENDHQAGITDFVNRCFESGSTSRDAATLSRDFSRIGANLTLYDNPWIPYDDRYTTRQFSFIKFETISEFAEDGLDLLADMIINPRFAAEEVEQVRGSMLAVISRQSGSVRDQAKNLFYKEIFEGFPYAKPIMGTSQSIGLITIDDLRTHHRRMYAPENMILAVSCNQSPAKVMGWLKAKLGAVPNSGEPSVTLPSAPPMRSGVYHHEMDKEQSQIIFGAPIPSFNPDHSAALQIAGSILSSRLYLNLREKQGLAYSIGAGVTLDRDFGWFSLSIGTGYKNYQAALEGMKGELTKLIEEGPTIDEVSRARNHLWGRLMSAKLSRINQAYYMCLNEFYGRDLTWDAQYLKLLAQVTPESLKGIYEEYLGQPEVLVVSAGKKP